MAAMKMPRISLSHVSWPRRGVIFMRRLGVIVALGALLCVLGGVVTASPALAGRGPQWQPPSGEPFTLPALFCGFEVRVAFPVNEEFTKILKTSDGSTTFLFTGAVETSFTNLQTGKTITENTPGPGEATIHPDGSITEVHTGRNGPFILTPAHAKRFGLPTVSMTAGKLAFSVAADGTITSLSLDGHVLVDVCAALS
jgi:hypothetical protein